MILFHRLRQRASELHAHHHAFRHHHEHDRHGYRLGYPLGEPGGHRDACSHDGAGLLLGRLGAKLDLGAEQQERLAELLAQLQRQRRALRAAGPALAGLFAADNFARQEARRLLDAELDALRDAGPALVEALGDFFDALDFEQQQALRFMLRRLRRGRPA
ncbi:MAG TPA: Spy/CpxP family protein refolding chaperone [Roseateles sp.]|nr:Spy/CpxP family protein refolding chaperone [Roseateles sp.]